MTMTRIVKPIALGVLLLSLAACGGGGLFGGGQGDEGQEATGNAPKTISPRVDPQEGGGSKLWDLFRKQNPDVTVAVNRYLWNGTLDVLNFLPLESVDPFTGVIVFGYGTPPGGGRAYRGTVYIKDPALDARSLVVALQTRRGPVDAATQRAIEDAILARARQLRIADRKF